MANRYHESQARLLDQRYKWHSNVLCAARQNPFKKFIRWSSSTPRRERAANGGGQVGDDRRVSRKPITKTHPVYNPSWRHQRQEGFVLQSPIIRYRLPFRFYARSIVDDVHLPITRERERKRERDRERKSAAYGISDI